MLKQLKDIDIQLDFEHQQFNMVSGLLEDYYDDSNFKLDSVFLIHPLDSSAVKPSIKMTLLTRLYYQQATLVC